MAFKQIRPVVVAGLGTAALVTAAVGITQQHSQRSEPQQLPQKRADPVQNDLETAMKGEALAYAKYMLFAEQARAHGHPEIAALFEKTAKTERMEHFREHAELAGVLKSSDADNLRSAIEGETYETTKMYPEMAARARQAGDNEVAARFSEIGNDESKHRDAFAAALAKLDGSRNAATSKKQ